MASTKVQMEEMNKPKPRRYILELHTIRGMIQEADNMDKGLKAVLGLGVRPSAMPGSGPPAPQPPQPPPTMGTPASFAPPALPAAPPASAVVSRPTPAPPFQPGHRKKLSQAQAPAAVSTPTPPPIQTASTPTPQATTPGITAPSPQTPKSPKGKAAAKPKSQPRRKVSAKASSVETPTATSIVAPTPTPSTPMETKGGAKRVRDDDADSATPGVVTAPSPKRVKSDWEGLPNEEVRKRDEQANNVKTDEQTVALVESLTKFIDQNPESAEAASNALDEILRRTYPPSTDIDNATVVSSYGFGDLPSTSPPHPLGNDDFTEYIDFSAFEDTPTPDLAAGSSTNPSPESTSDQDHPHMGHAGSPQVSNSKPEDAYDLLRQTVCKQIAGGDTMFHQTSGWKWEGPMETPDQAWAISTS
jgi:hypothetical protein